MPYNITVDDISPLITYTGTWVDSYESTGDPYTNRYWGESFHASQTNGSQASVTFNGTAIYIFGAKRQNHGHYIVTINNGQAQRFDGYAPKQLDGTDGVYQVPLFVQTGLSNGMHTVVLTNDSGADTGRPYVDIDFITWTSGDPAGTSNNTIDDRDFTYTTPSKAWFETSTEIEDYYNRTGCGTNVGGAQASLTFEGAGFYLYGGTSNSHGTYSIQIDGQTVVGLKGKTQDYHAQQLLYYADGLAYGTHKLTVTNTQDQAYLSIDYIDIIQFNPRGQAKTPIIAGVVCGIVIGLAWLIAAVWWFMRRRKRKAEGADLLNSESKPYVPPAGYGPASGGPGWNDTATPANSMARDQPWANDPAYTGAYTQSNSNSGSYPLSTYPPSSVSGSGPSSGDRSAYGGGVHARPSAQHQPLSSLTQISESDAHVNELVSPPNIKGRPAVVPNTGPMGEAIEDELREQRMRVPERPQDWGPVLDNSDHETGGMLPPDYNQATEPFPARRPGAV